MKYILISLILSLSVNLSAKEKFICAALTFNEYKSEVPELENDKVKHCTFSCILRVECSAAESWSIGIVKEIADLLGYGEPDFADLAANRRGIRIGGQIDDLYECLPRCRELRDLNEI